MNTTQSADAILKTSQAITDQANASADEADRMATELENRLDTVVANAKRILEAHRSSVREHLTHFAELMANELGQLAQLTTALGEHCTRVTAEFEQHTQRLKALSNGDARRTEQVPERTDAARGDGRIAQFE